MHVVPCPNCGAPMQYANDGSTPGCPYCGHAKQRTRIEESGFFTKTVSAIYVEVKTNVYRLGIDGGRAHGTRTKIVRGVKLKDEQLPLDRWVEELSRDLSMMAEENQHSSDALKRFLHR